MLKIKKKPVHPRDQNFTKEEAVLLLKGEYYSDEEEDYDPMGTIGNEEQKLDLNRAMFVGVNDPKKELEIDDFEQLLG